LIELSDAAMAVKQRNRTLSSISCFPGRIGRLLRDILGHADRDDLPDPLARAAIGASLGAIAGALADVSIDGQFIKDAGQRLQTSIAAIFLLNLARSALRRRAVSQAAQFISTLRA
jgi:uncharacterized membrane protein